MKTKIFFILIGLIATGLSAQNITNTLGTSGVFKIKDGSTDYLTLNQSTGQINILKTLRLENTTSSTTGVIYKGIERFLHNWGTGNTFLGINSGNFTMTGSSNSAFGYTSLLDNTTGSFNSAFGDASLTSNTTGYFNSAFGYFSLSNNTTGYNNSAFGCQSLTSNATGYNNSAFGINSLFNNTTGYNNSAFGINSLFNNTTGNYNSAFGILTLGNNTTGNFNTGFGFLSGDGITTGSNNTVIGNQAQVPSGTSNNQIRVGNTAVTYAGVQVAWTITSDRKWKENIFSSNLGLGFISKLNPVSYTRINDETGKTEYGLIAQEVEQVLKEENANNTAMITVTDEGNYELRYNDLLAPMVKAIQELNEENQNLKIKNQNLEERLNKLEKLVSQQNEMTEK